MQNENFRGITFLVVAMGFFALTDTFVKLGAEVMPKGQVLFFLGGGGAVIFAGLTRLRGHAIFARDFLSRGLILRNVAEITATFSFITALSTVGISQASAIIQAMPLVVTLVAIVLLRERVGWRRWGAIFVGLVGVLVILRPGMAGFDMNALWAVSALFALSIRDVSTRLAPDKTPSTRIAFYGLLMLAPTGAVHMALVAPPVAMDGHSIALMAGAVLAGAVGYYTMVAAMRLGEISTVAPFRYSRILFALIIGYTVFGERPDIWTYLGAAITIIAGVYAFWREARIARKTRLMTEGIIA
ncbi:DMT family transporter [Aquicoccus sp. G2-2]|uniref:DMT family transporter n=1 Tax=Aquicoccus sp. G2-2 TaxID=3092120 RepID=UPI002AE07340|nr:DMT family transporter [Aquicoccus sp. G2-2]MEA1112814.1 DMT family transporter [Aquicoccus sp. G2-2]